MTSARKPAAQLGRVTAGFVLALAFTVACLSWRPGVLSAQDALAKDGMFITVLDPISESVLAGIQAKVKKAIERQKRPIQVIVFDFNPFGQPAGTSSFGAANDLADYIRNLRLGQVQATYPRIHTVAFVHNEVSKHTVLPVLACGEIVMSNKVKEKSADYLARIGDVLRGQEVLSLPARKAYEIVAETYPSKDLIFRMIDRELVLRKVQTREGVRYVDQARIAKLKMEDPQLTVAPDVPPGLEVGKTTFDPDRALQYGLAKAIYNSRAELAAALKLPRSSLNEDWIDAPRATLFEVRGQLDKGQLESLERRIRAAIGREGINFVILRLDAEGGDSRFVPASAQWLRELKNNNNVPVHTVAYIPPGRSIGAATFLALGCNDIVMAQTSVLADFSYLLHDPEIKTEDLNRLKDMLVPLAKEQGYPPKLFEATLDRDLVLYRVKAKADPADERLVAEAELADPRWQALGRLNRPDGKFLTITADLAREWHVAQFADVETLQALYDLYDLDASKVRVSRGDWLEDIADFFRNPVVNFVLIMLGIVGLMMELKMPGTAVGGILSATCFILFFWAYSYVGQFTLLAILLFVLGLILLGIELFILPGFGITGVSGIMLVVTSLVLVTLEKMPETTQDWLDLTQTLTTLGLSLVGAMIAIFFLAYYMPNIPYAHRLVLTPPDDTPAGHDAGPDSGNPFAALLGAIGVAATALRPSGKARFGDDFLDVIAEGDFVNPGSRVQVIEIEGNRIVVKEV